MYVNGKSVDYDIRLMFETLKINPSVFDEYIREIILKEDGWCEWISNDEDESDEDEMVVELLPKLNLRRMVVKNVYIWDIDFSPFTEASEPLRKIMLPRVIHFINLCNNKYLRDIEWDYVENLSISGCPSLKFTKWPLGIKTIELHDCDNFVFDRFPDILNELTLHIDKVTQLNSLYEHIDKINECYKLSIYLNPNLCKDVTITPTFLVKDNISNVDIYVSGYWSNSYHKLISPPVADYRPTMGMSQMFRYVEYLNKQLNKLK